ncbi:MAG: prepilin-type N-terminal cleavage/methylation domain-containing protein [Prochloraceae cyanobacterium]|nr:prepilin-type N-terminal cleavage/methylation domain-containing protein [Prochloraceae cyanobacterium]
MQLLINKFLIKPIGDKTSLSNSSVAGFTLVEMLVVVVLVGILAAISANSWNAFIDRQRLDSANERVVSALQDARTQAKKKRSSYSAHFQNNNGIPQYAILPEASTPSNSDWQNLLSEKANTINLSFSSSQANKLTFDYKGNAKENTVNQSIIVSPTNSSSSLKRCAVVENLLGSVIIKQDSDCP